MSKNRGYILFDDHHRDYLLPLTFIRPVCEIRIGILTIKEKWERRINSEFSYYTVDYLKEKFPLVLHNENVLINGSVTPNEELSKEIMQLNPGEYLMKDHFLIAACLNGSDMAVFDTTVPQRGTIKEVRASFNCISRPWHIFRTNGEEIESDFKLITKGRVSEVPGSSNNIINKDNVFIEKGAQLEFATINAGNGPVYIGKNTEIMEGALIRGPLALCEGAVIKMGARIYGHNTIGPYSKIGGEVTNSVIMGYSNKVHEGYIGNSVVGEWCNIGSGSNTSNLKNNYSLVKIWSYVTGKAEESGLQFCGLIMGDFSRCGINTMFNTGMMIGISTNVFGAGFAGNFIPSFSWGGPAGFETYRLGEAIDNIQAGLSLKQKLLSETDKKIITYVFSHSGH